MELIEDWSKIRTHFRASLSANLHVAISSVCEDGFPTVSPVGSLFLNDNQTGFYFEKYVTKLPQNSVDRSQICVLGVNSSKLFWIKSLIYGKFDRYPAVKLYGTLGLRREASEKEKERLKRLVRSTSWLKGNKYLWSEMPYVREISFHKAEKINLGKMTANL
jgi:hypothetical protein